MHLPHHQNCWLRRQHQQWPLWSFHLAEFNSNTSNCSIHEWLDIAVVNDEFHVVDIMIFAKAGDDIKVHGTNSAKIHSVLSQIQKLLSLVRIQLRVWSEVIKMLRDIRRFHRGYHEKLFWVWLNIGWSFLKLRIFSVFSVWTLKENFWNFCVSSIRVVSNTIPAAEEIGQQRKIEHTFKDFCFRYVKMEYGKDDRNEK